MSGATAYLHHGWFGDFLKDFRKCGSDSFEADIRVGLHHFVFRFVIESRVCPKMLEKLFQCALEFQLCHHLKTRRKTHIEKNTSLLCTQTSSLLRHLSHFREQRLNFALSQIVNVLGCHVLSDVISNALSVEVASVWNVVYSFFCSARGNVLLWNQ